MPFLSPQTPTDYATLDANMTSAIAELALGMQWFTSFTVFPAEYTISIVIRYTNDVTFQYNAVGNNFVDMEGNCLNYKTWQEFKRYVNSLHE